MPIILFFNAPPPPSSIPSPKEKLFLPLNFHSCHASPCVCRGGDSRHCQAEGESSQSKGQFFVACCCVRRKGSLVMVFVAMCDWKCLSATSGGGGGGGDIHRPAHGFSLQWNSWPVQSVTVCCGGFLSLSNS